MCPVHIGIQLCSLYFCNLSCCRSSSISFFYIPHWRWMLGVCQPILSGPIYSFMMQLLNFFSLHIAHSKTFLQEPMRQWIMHIVQNNMFQLNSKNFEQCHQIDVCSNAIEHVLFHNSPFSPCQMNIEKKTFYRAIGCCFGFSLSVIRTYVIWDFILGERTLYILDIRWSSKFSC